MCRDDDAGDCNGPDAAGTDDAGADGEACWPVLQRTVSCLEYTRRAVYRQRLHGGTMLLRRRLAEPCAARSAAVYLLPGFTTQTPRGPVR
jgi:hypothetical protein